MALFAIQLVHIVVTSLVEPQAVQTQPGLTFGLELVITIHEMLNVIIRSVPFFTFFCFY